jgi:hypothetical protein
MLFYVRFAFCAVLVAGCVQQGNGVGGDHDLSGIPDDGGDDQGFAADDLSGDMTPVFDVQPSTTQMITIAPGATMPGILYTATFGGQPVSAAWSVDRGDVGGVGGGPASSTTFTPTGGAGGLVTLSAGLNGVIVQRQIQVSIAGSQNGVSTNPAEQQQIAGSVGALTAGGGVGGVGGEGLGAGVTAASTLAALSNPSSNGSAQGLTFLYPYDQTVWARGLLAPLLMWSWSVGDADAIQIKLTTQSGSFGWTGTFARPAILTTNGGKFIRHPIPQDVWDMATNTAGGSDTLTVSLTVASGGVGYGPISETWTIAKGRLGGIIYYNSYGTQLAQNLTGAVGGSGKFGGAVLSIHAGDTGPQLAAGSSGNASNCRVCHSVAAYGSRLVVQHGDNNYATSSAFDLTTSGNVEHVMTNNATFGGVYPDGSKVLTSSGVLLPLPADTAPISISGLSAVTTNVGAPAFSPDGKLVAFNPMAGPTTNPTQKLIVMSFDPMMNVFSGALTVSDDSGQPGTTRPGWPAFLPDGKSLVFHHQTAAGNDGNGSGQLYTRSGSKAHLSWAAVSATPSVIDLDKLNGKGYLPKLPAASGVTCNADNNAVGGINPDHADDVNLNYEPTVSPLPSGGYAWVVFTSRRMYGNEATIPPFCSDPRGVDLVQNITTKKLWVAAIDLSTGTVDPSHPAFYLPGQELLAGNARGYWVLDPCRMDGQSCMTGDQCCNGYCEAGGDGGLICTNTPPNNHCAGVQEKCDSTTPCCDPTNLCINGFCSSQIN